MIIVLLSVVVGLQFVGLVYFATEPVRRPKGFDLTAMLAEGDARRTRCRLKTEEEQWNGWGVDG